MKKLIFVLLLSFICSTAYCDKTVRNKIGWKKQAVHKKKVKRKKPKRHVVYKPHKYKPVPSGQERRFWFNKQNKTNYFIFS